MRWIYSVVILFLVSHMVSGQIGDERFIKGKVIDKETNYGIPFAQIASYKMVAVFAADSVGRFNIVTNKNDSLKVFSIGYEPFVFYVTDTVDQDNVTNIYLKQQGYVLDAVEVYPWSKEKLEESLDMKLGKESSVPIHVRSEFGGKPTVISALKSPVSTGYYFFSRREKRKRKMRKLLAKEKFEGYLTNELIRDISGLSGSELSNFRVYCNTRIQLSNRDNAHTVRFKVLDALHQYMGEKKNEIE